MKLTPGTSSKWGRRLVRGVAVFFVLFAFADIFFPEYCRESAERLPVAGVASHSSGGEAAGLVAADLSSEDSRPDKPSEPAPHDGDCLGCCAHVLAGTALDRAAAQEVKSFPASLMGGSPSSPPLRGPYHPPRLA